MQRGDRVDLCRCSATIQRSLGMPPDAPRSRGLRTIHVDVNRDARAEALDPSIAASFSHLVLYSSSDARVQLAAPTSCVPLETSIEGWFNGRTRLDG